MNLWTDFHLLMKGNEQCVHLVAAPASLSVLPADRQSVRPSRTLNLKRPDCRRDCRQEETEGDENGSLSRKDVTISASRRSTTDRFWPEPRSRCSCLGSSSPPAVCTDFLLAGRRTHSCLQLERLSAGPPARLPPAAQEVQQTMSSYKSKSSTSVILL